MADTVEVFKRTVDPNLWKVGVSTVTASNPGLTPDTPEHDQAVVDLLRKSGVRPQAQAITAPRSGEVFGFGTRKVSPTVPTDPKEYKKWQAAKNKGLAESTSVPRIEVIGPHQLIGPARPTAEDAISGTGINISPTGPLSPAEREKYLGLRNEQERKRIAADKARADKNAREEADRVAMEQLRLQKESELLQYKTDYFASPQIGIYIGDRWLGNAVTIEFTENVSKAPLYGYASTHFDAVSKGNVIVQGQLTIAYTGENYLPAILDRYHRGEGIGDSIPFDVKDPIERAKKLFWNLENINEPVDTKPLQYGYFGGKTGLVGNGFNIRVFYGSQNFLLDSFGTAGDLKFSGPIQTIRNVHLTSRSLVIQPTGDPIGETYTFFARSITTGVQRQSISPNKVIRNRDGQNTPIATTSGTTPSGLRNEPNRGPV